MPKQGEPGIFSHMTDITLEMNVGGETANVTSPPTQLFHIAEN